MKMQDLTGLRFNELTVLQIAPAKLTCQFANAGKKVYWLCECSCGGSRIAHSYDLKIGKVPACKACIKSGRVKIAPYTEARRKEDLTEWKRSSDIKLSNNETSPYLRYWKKYFAEFNTNQKQRFEEIMKGRKRYSRNLAEATELICIEDYGPYGKDRKKFA